MKLKQIASILMGYPFRSRLEPSEDGNVSVIQMKDVNESNRIDTECLTRIHLPDLKEHHIVQAEDLVFRSRGNVNTSAIIQQDLGTAVLAAPLLRIRIMSKQVLPAYLNWFINQPASQVYLASHARGTSVSMISKQAVEEMDVTVPPLTQQRIIVELAELGAREQELLKRLAEKRRSYISKLLMEFALR